MAEFEFELTNFDNVINRLEAWGENVVDAVNEAVEEAIDVAHSSVQSNVPIRSGDLKETIQKTKVGWAFGVISVGGDGAPHARPVEAKESFFNRSIGPVQESLSDRIYDHVVRKAFR